MMTIRLQKLLTSFSLMLFGIIVACALMEAVVRLFFPEPILPRFVVDLGYGVRANQPNVVMRHFVPNEYDVVISNNSAGMRGTREYSVLKPPNVRRIAVIGDSFVYGFGVNDNEVISSVLENELNAQAENGPFHYEVINFSVSGFGQAEQLITYYNQIRKYNPDEIILFYFSNDIGNNAVSNLFSVGHNGSIDRRNRNYLPGVKVREILYGNLLTRTLFTHSQAWNFVRNRLSQIVQTSLLKKQGLTSFTEEKPEAVELTKALVLEFIREIKKDGGRATIIIIPNKKIHTNFPLKEKMITATETSLIDGRAYLTSDDYYKSDIHWRPSGHKKMAAIIADTLTGNLQSN